MPDTDQVTQSMLILFHHPCLFRGTDKGVGGVQIAFLIPLGKSYWHILSQYLLMANVLENLVDRFAFNTNENLSFAWKWWTQALIMTWLDKISFCFSFFPHRVYPWLRGLGYTSLGLFLLGFLLWNIDNIFCESLR